MRLLDRFTIMDIFFPTRDLIFPIRDIILGTTDIFSPAQRLVDSVIYSSFTAVLLRLKPCLALERMISQYYIYKERRIPIGVRLSCEILLISSVSQQRELLR